MTTKKLVSWSSRKLFRHLSIIPEKHKPIQEKKTWLAQYGHCCNEQGKLA